MKITKLFLMVLELFFMFMICSCDAINTVEGEEEHDFFIRSANPQLTITSSKAHYYFFSGPTNHFLYIIDKKSLKVEIVCKKSNCLHTEEQDPQVIPSCNAFWGHANNMYGFLSCYKNNIYMLNYLQIPDHKLEFSILQSSDNEKPHAFYKFSDIPTNYLIYKDFLYFATINQNGGIDNLNDCKLFRLNLNNLNENPELLYETQGYGNLIQDFYGHENMLYFSIASFSNKSSTASLAYFDVNTNIVKMISDKAGRYAICGDRLFYNFYDGIESHNYTCNLDGTDIQLFDKIVGVPYSDDKYIITDASAYKQKEPGLSDINVYNLDGTLKSAIDSSKHKSFLYCGSDDTYLFFRGREHSDYGAIDNLYVVAKNNLLDKKLVFQYVPSFQWPGFTEKIAQ